MVATKKKQKALIKKYLNLHKKLNEFIDSRELPVQKIEGNSSDKIKLIFASFTGLLKEKDGSWFQ